MTRRAALLNALSLAATLALLAQGTGAQREPRRRAAPPPKAACCEDVRALKLQLANVSSLLEELWRKQESEARGLSRQMLELERRSQNQEERVTEAEGKYSEINNRVEIMQLQTAQAVTHTSAGKRARRCQAACAKWQGSVHLVRIVFFFPSL